MTRDETIKVLAIIKAAFPASYRHITKEEANATVAVWAAQFADVPAAIVMIAVNKLIATNTFPPSISEVKSKFAGMYWEAVCELGRDQGDPMEALDKKTYLQLKAIEMACAKYNTEKEPTIGSLLPAYQKYLSDGSE